MKARVRVSDKGSYLVYCVTRADGASLVPFAISKSAFEDVPMFERMMTHKMKAAKVLPVRSIPEPMQ